MAFSKIRPGFLYPFIAACAATLMLATCGGNDGGGGGVAPAAGPTSMSGSTPAPVAQTWFFPDGAVLTAGQITSFDAQGLYFNSHSAANPGGEIRGQIVPSSATFSTDAGSPATSNTFSTLMTSDQEVPVTSSAATGYGTIALDPAAKTISGVLVTNGIVGTAAHIHEGAPGVAGPIIIPLSGGPTVWTVPPGTIVTDDQIAKLKAGAYYLNVHSTGAPGGEIRGQLTQELRFAALSGANEVPAVTTTATGNGVLALNPVNGQIRGFVKTTGITGTAAHIHEAAAGIAGPIIIPLAETPAGSGFWIVPAGQTLTPGQIASFNAGNLYFNVHSKANPGGEIRSQIVAATVKIGNAALDGSKEVPPVTTSASGTGIMVLNSITGLVTGNLSTTGITGTAAHVHEGAAGANGAIIIPLSLTPPPSTLVLTVSTASLPDGAVGSPYSQSLIATGGTTPYTWTVASGTLPAGLTLDATGMISGTPTAAGPSSFTVRVTDSAAPVATASHDFTLAVAAAPAAPPPPPPPPPAPPTPAAVSFSAQIQPIFTANCVVCHSPSGGASFMNLTAGNAYASLVPQRVTAGNSAGSLLYQKITGAVPPQMPLGRPPLSDTDQTLIKNWIDQGAQNN
ncbi:CHRD domain-containing protein [Herbaspirillum sp. HC18]|nr:CHRD domain-containing protein [Herbaspirillum sp. HC18]